MTVKGQISAKSELQQKKKTRERLIKTNIIGGFFSRFFFPLIFFVNDNFLAYYITPFSQ